MGKDSFLIINDGYNSHHKRDLSGY